MQRGGGAAIRHPYLRFMCTRCGRYHAVVLATCNWQQGAPQQGQRVRILARSSSLKVNTAGALDLYRSMFYKRSTYIYISFSILVLVVGISRHPAAAAGTPMCGRDPSARSAGDKRQRREGRLQVGFGQIYALFLVRYTPCFWLKYTPNRRFWKTRRIIQGVFF